MNKTKIIALVVVGVLVVGGGVAFSMTSKKKRREEMEDNLDDEFDDEFDDDGNKSSSSTSSKKPSTATAPAPVADMSKKETISAWKADKADIKSICGRRRIIGKKKREWLACVKANSGFDGVSETDDFYSFEGNYVEVNSMLTDLF